jgi:hypothetical protein
VLFGDYAQTSIKLKTDLYTEFLGLPVTHSRNSMFPMVKMKAVRRLCLPLRSSSMLVLRSAMVSLASEGNFLKVVEFRAHAFLHLSVQPDIPHDSLNISWQRTLHHDSYSQPRDTMAISAFFLSTLRTSLQRKSLVKDMWESGAETIVCRLITNFLTSNALLYVGSTRSQQSSRLPKRRRGQRTSIKLRSEGSRGSQFRGKHDFRITCYSAGSPSPP